MIFFSFCFILLLTFTDEKQQKFPFLIKIFLRIKKIVQLD